MLTLTAWLEQHPEASVIDAVQGQSSGAKWVQADPVALRELNRLSDFKVAHRGSSWLLKPAGPGRGKYGGPIPVAELDLPRREESVQSEVDALLETPKSTERVIRSIGWLNGEDNTVILTPVFQGNTHATKVRITREEFDLVRHDVELMKAKARAALKLARVTS